MSASSYRLGIDIGGTFTDLFLLNEQTGEMISVKTPTVPSRLPDGIVNGIGILEQRGIDPTSIHYFVHGMTTGLNTVLQRSGAKLALFVTEGFRDLLELQRLRLPIPYDFGSRMPRPLIDRRRVLPVRERLNAAGEVVVPLDDASLDAAIEEAARLGVEGIVVCFLHSYRNPEHERRAAERIREKLPHIDVTVSSDILPQFREYERAMAAILNAYIKPKVKHHFELLQLALQRKEIGVLPHITQSNGGIMSLKAAAAKPVYTLMSGPAAGIQGAIHIARLAGQPNLIALDVGGTSADIAVIQDGQAQLTNQQQLDGLPIVIPTQQIFSIGAGGGSVAWLDSGGLLKIGPQSVGSDPGPACYGKGDQVTLTDAYLICGYLNPGTFADGAVAIDPQRARECIRPLAEALGTDELGAADRIIRVAAANMYAEMTSIMEQIGIDVRIFSLFAYGGGGPVIANLLAEELNVESVLIPPSPGTLCALGSLVADFVHEEARTVLHDRWNEHPERMRERFAELRRLAEQCVTEQPREHMEAVELMYEVEARYQHQSFELALPLQREWVEEARVDAIQRAFHELHRQRYGHADQQAPVEWVQAKVRVIARTPKPRFAELPAADISANAGRLKPRSRRDVTYNGRTVTADIYHRNDLRYGDRIEGPAVIEQSDTTTLVLDGWRAEADRYGNVWLRRREALEGEDGRSDA